MGLVDRILSAHRSHSVVAIFNKEGTEFSGAKICQPELQPKQRWQKCERERVIDVISWDCVSHTQNKQMWFENKHFSTTSSPLPHNKRSFEMCSGLSPQMSVPKKPNTPIVIAEYKIGRGEKKSNLQM